jgi:hypothetical protein
VSEQADEGRREAEIGDEAEARAVRWAQEVGDAYRDLWDVGVGVTDAEAEAIVEAEVYEHRQEQRRRPT